ncbi:MAG: glycosyltransferase, partial [Gammaproteobacteria bacterium]|nr:glycosyltransferase [Gammaproteobacteria bacterium]
MNLINLIPCSRYRHAIICLTSFTDYRLRIQKDIPIHALGKKEGQDFGLYVNLFRLLRRLRPAVVHTRNLATLEMQIPAWMAGVPIRIHGEHGRDTHDLDNTQRKYKLLRSALRPLIHHYVVVSRDLQDYLAKDVGVLPTKMTRIVNGVDTSVYHPNGSLAELPTGFREPGIVVVGTVGRMELVKDQLTLARAFIRLAGKDSTIRQRIRLVLIGEGQLRKQLTLELARAGLSEQSWIPGTRNDIPELL